MVDHPHEAWLAFLRQIDRETPKDKVLHLICDNYATHKHPRVKAWLKKHPRFRMHFTPTSGSWLNMVEQVGWGPSPPLIELQHHEQNFRQRFQYKTLLDTRRICDAGMVGQGAHPTIKAAGFNPQHARRNPTCPRRGAVSAANPPLESPQTHRLIAGHSALYTRRRGNRPMVGLAALTTTLRSKLFGSSPGRVHSGCAPSLKISR